MMRAAVTSPPCPCGPAGLDLAWTPRLACPSLGGFAPMVEGSLAHVEQCGPVCFSH